MAKEKRVHYKDYEIVVTPYDKLCSKYSYVIRDSSGEEIKHVDLGGDTEDTALENAREIIDFEIGYAEEKG